ncbi:MAG: hypothetical protein HY866_16595 [Chloroflexi bacterium]|nr:hypothetical protein [Chloroflexota bacterium]
MALGLSVHTTMFDKFVGQTFTKKAPVWAFVLGLVLVGLALVFLFSARSAAHPSPSVQRVRVMQAVADLQACLTCHSAPAELTQVVSHHIAEAAHSHLTDFVPLSATGTKTEVRDQLVSLGQRILAVPPSESDLTAAAENEFLRIYDQVRSGESGNETLMQLRALAEMVNLLEHQAFPVQWDQQPVPSFEQGKLAAVQGFSTAPDSAAAFGYTGEYHIVVVSRWNGTQPVITVPAEAVLGIHRRGPPAVAHFIFV